MKLKAYQIAPEYQEAPMLEDFVGLEICGNRYYARHTSDEFDDILHELEFGRDFSGWTISDADREELAELVDKYGSPRAQDEKILARVLSIVTGQHWEYMEVLGSFSGDWQGVYYNTSVWTPEGLRVFEMDYFNTGREWRVVGDDGDECYIYTYGDTSDEIKAEIADAMGTSKDNVTLYYFDGWTRTEKYKEA